MFAFVSSVRICTVVKRLRKDIEGNVKVVGCHQFELPCVIVPLFGIDRPGVIISSSPSSKRSVCAV